MNSEITLLARQIEASFSGSTTEVEFFPSGSAMLDVRWLGRLFVMAYSPAAGGFGVDEVSEEDGFNSGYRFVSNEFSEAADELYRLLKDAT
jgi:hypothetical protein